MVPNINVLNARVEDTNVGFYWQKLGFYCYTQWKKSSTVKIEKTSKLQMSIWLLKAYFLEKKVL